jgi:hypothetical protein
LLPNGIGVRVSAVRDQRMSIVLEDNPATQVVGHLVDDLLDLLVHRRILPPPGFEGTKTVVE